MAGLLRACAARLEAEQVFDALKRKPSLAQIERQLQLQQLTSWEKAMSAPASSFRLDQPFLLVKPHGSKRALAQPGHVARGEEVVAFGFEG